MSGSRGDEGSGWPLQNHELREGFHLLACAFILMNPIRMLLVCMYSCVRCMMSGLKGVYILIYL